jgi:hypothetical protein
MEEIIYSNVQAKEIYCWDCFPDPDVGLTCQQLAPCSQADCIDCGFTNSKSECEGIRGGSCYSTPSPS